MSERAPHVALYPGSFDPPTYGHLDVVARGRRLFDRLVVGIGHNPEKRTAFTSDERVTLLRELVDELVKAEPNAAEIDVVTFSGLTIDCARRHGASILLRGVRNLSDLQYEIQHAVTNREVADLETAFVVAGQSFAYTSSTLIRQITALGEDLSILRTMVPPVVIEALLEKKGADPNGLRDWGMGGGDDS
jgi:pantetheine-phosphate adenylyltransferase